MNDEERITKPENVSRREVTVDDASAGKRLDAVLAAALSAQPAEGAAPESGPPLSRTRLQALVKEGAVHSLTGEAVVNPSTKVTAGQTFIVNIPPPAPAKPAAQTIALDVVYEDDDLIVIDKPAGLVVHPGPGSPDGTLVNALLAHCGASLSGIGGVARPGIVHRIDKDTTGLLVVAKSDSAHAGLSTQFADHSIDRVYLALVWGEPRPLTGHIKANIGRHPQHRTKMAAVRDGGRHAETYYKVTARFAGIVTQLECRLTTGRTHQIRVHMAHAGNPLIGDRLYGGQRHLPGKWRDEPVGGVVETFGRQALHAATLGFVHPLSGEALSFDSPLPSDLAGLIDSLESLKNNDQRIAKHERS